ncbi:MAG TPA: helicase-associated domain-containing protein [Actinomycetales bacterium]|nr:helicase-associated domain-containing protein [Actinomycetales bacterium]
MPAPARGRAVRTLADDLRARDDAALVALLGARPDLATPVPADTASLAARASTRVSVHRALDTLDSPTLQVAQALAALGSPTASRDLARACGGRIGPQVSTLRRLALVWGPDAGLRLVRAAADVLGPHPAGLGPPLAEISTDPARLADWLADLGLPGTGDPVTAVDRITALVGDPEALETLLSTGPDAARRLLERLTWGSPVGAVAGSDRRVRAAAADGGVEWLLARALLVAADAGHVVVPREVGLALRGGRVHDHLTPRPVPEPQHRRPDVADGTAAGAAAEAVRLVDALADLWSAAPAPILRAGGLGVRELRRVSLELDVEADVAARVVEIAYAAGLVASDGGSEPSWAPTPGYDIWAGGTTGERWVVLARAWLATSRVADLVGTRDSRDAVRLALTETVDRPAVVAVRAAVLVVLAGLDPGHSLTPDDLSAALTWQAPRGAHVTQPPLVPAVLGEAAWLGVTGLGAVSAHGRALLDDGPADAVLEHLLPEVVDHVLLQADLTAVAPGPLATDVSRELALMADVDSRGGATVYRFDAGTLRRALDGGRTAADILEFLTTHSRTPVPQPLEYLVADTARRHGRVRVGAASAYLRSDDEAVLAELVVDSRAAVLRLRRLAPTVLAAQADPATVLQTLRGMGYAPAAEGADGSLVLRRPGAHRTPPRQPPRPVTHLPAPGPQLAEAVVRGLRQADADASAAPRPAHDAPALPAMDPAMSLATLRRAASERGRVWIGLADPGGRVTRRLVEPLDVNGGRITVFDHGTGEVRTLSVHRVTGVATDAE